jgi:hypothetical protein
MYDGDKNDDKGRKPASDDTYEVGWGKPPTEKQFKPGRSGNQTGRPRGARNKRPLEKSLAALVSKVANGEIRIKEAGQEITVTMAEAVLKRTAVDGLKGNHRAARNFLGVVERADRFEQAKLERKERDQEKQRQDATNAVINYKLGAENFVKQCNAEGRKPPEMYPRPDHIIVDLPRDRVLVIGPVCKEEVPKWELILDLLGTLDRRIGEEKEKLDSARNSRTREKISDTIASLEASKARTIEATAWSSDGSTGWYWLTQGIVWTEWKV